MSCEFPFAASAFYRDIQKGFVDVVTVTYPSCKFDYSPKLTGIISHAVILPDM